MMFIGRHRNKSALKITLISEFVKEVKTQLYHMSDFSNKT